MIPRLIKQATAALCSLALGAGSRAGLGLALAIAAGCSATPAAETTTAKEAPGKFLIIAHRGASGYRPEHTIAAYRLAIEQGADFVEPDLVPTKDGVLIARHENALAVVKLDNSQGIELDADGLPSVIAATTDVAERPEFSHLLTVRSIDGRPVAGWFSEDFTFAEIKTLYARERIPQLRPDNQNYKKLRIASLEEILQLVQETNSRASNPNVGIYPELKHPTHFRYGLRTENGPPINIDTAALLTQQLSAAGFTDSRRIYIQCFEAATLRRLKRDLLPAAGFDAPLVQLLGKLEWQLPDVEFHLRRSAIRANPSAYLESIYGPLAKSLVKDSTYRNLTTTASLASADYLAGIGPRKGDAKLLAHSTITLGLELHPYTVRAEPYFLSTLRGALANNVASELEKLRTLGATGVFIDQPDLAVRWLRANK